MSYKQATSMTGNVYSYQVDTVKEFKMNLSQEKSIPYELIKILHEEKTLSDITKMSSDLIYFILIASPNPYNMVQWVYERYAHTASFWALLSENPAAIPILEENPKNINWTSLSANPNAMHLLETNPQKVDWDQLLRNPSSIPFLEKHAPHLHQGDPLHRYLKLLVINPNAVHYFENRLDEFPWVWTWFSRHTTTMHLLEANQDKINWIELSGNPAAIHLLEANQDKINWVELSCNPAAIHLLEANQDKINWMTLSLNPNAIPLLEANVNKINWERLSTNSSAFDLLNANPERIHWGYATKNPHFIQLVRNHKERYESFYRNQQYNHFGHGCNILKMPYIFYPSMTYDL